jgi:hypothetical protein
MPAQVLTYSRGAEVSHDDSIDSQVWDASVDALGTSAAIAAGNSGPASSSVNEPALAYNVIGVGAYCCSSAGSHVDDYVWDWSSRGPTKNGRKKPDLVAPGAGQFADALFQTTGALWHYYTGTSFAAPAVAGGATLLAGAGIRNPKIVKALLINSARLGRATSDQAMGTQVGWNADWGWGELDLDAAYSQRLNFVAGDVPASGARFFRGTTQASSDRATLVWHRRVDNCNSPQDGCAHDSTSGFRTYTLSNLDLAQYDAATGAQQAVSDSAIDNVEQVRASGAGSVVYKVTAGGVDALPGEPFALAATRPLTPLVTPRPSVSLTTSESGAIRPGQTVTVQATVSNPSPDLTAESPAVTLNVPDGVELVDGQPTRSFQTLGTNGGPGSAATATWTVRGSGDGLKQLIATATASRYGSSFGSSATAAFTVDASPPVPTIATQPSPDGQRIRVTWGASDTGAGVESYDVDSATDARPYEPWRERTGETEAGFDATPGAHYKFRVRARDRFGNVSDYVETPEITVPTHTPPPSTDPTTDPPTGQLESPRLSIKTVKRRGARLVVRGTVARGATGRVVGTLTGRRKHRRFTTRRSTHAWLQRFTLAIKLPRGVRGGRLTVRYAGSNGFASQTRRLTVRSK